VSVSELIVKVVSIDNIQPHPNADRLDLAVIAGWNCVVGKDQFKAGDKAIYLPIDSILPPELEGNLFPIDSKIKLKNSRIRTIKIRGAVSQGLVIRPEQVGLEKLPVGTDVKDKLGITKYEPPVVSVPSGMRGGHAVKKKNVNTNFSKYTDINNFKHYNTLFEPGEEVYVSEKIHGTSSRYGWFPVEVNTWWKRIKKFFGFLKPYEFCYGSRNVQLQSKEYTGYYEKNVYAKILKQEGFRTKLNEGEAIYGEIVGEAIQKGYTYGCKPGEHRFYAYDAMVDGKWLDYSQFVSFCFQRNIPRVPELYVGPFVFELIDNMRKGDSTVGGQRTREGVVIKPTVEKVSMVGRKVLKFINDDYLLKEDNTDFH
jgi:RNA ligase (TIGR02306 family)